jgi:hypothetical protein
MEQRNALVIAGDRGYQGRSLFSTEDHLATLRAIGAGRCWRDRNPVRDGEDHPDRGRDEVMAEAQRSLLSEDGNAELRDLAFDAKADDFAFERERVRRAPRRRVPISGAPATVPVQ